VALALVHPRSAIPIRIRTDLRARSQTYTLGPALTLQIAAGLKELQIESAFTHLAKLEEADKKTRAVANVKRSGGGV